MGEERSNPSRAVLGKHLLRFRCRFRTLGDAVCEASGLHLPLGILLPHPTLFTSLTLRPSCPLSFVVCRPLCWLTHAYVRTYVRTYSHATCARAACRCSGDHPRQGGGQRCPQIGVEQRWDLGRGGEDRLVQREAHGSLRVSAVGRLLCI